MTTACSACHPGMQAYGLRWFASWRVLFCLRSRRHVRGLPLAGLTIPAVCTKYRPNSTNGYRQTRYFPNLDGLRFICISMVLWHHAQPFERGTIQLFDRGFLGVDFFFVLSGFLITTLLLRESDQRGQFSIGNFYLRRILRIVPVYFFVVSAVIAYYGLVKGEQIGHLAPFYYLFLSNFLPEHIPTLSITWSLNFRGLGIETF